MPAGLLPCSPRRYRSGVLDWVNVLEEGGRPYFDHIPDDAKRREDAVVTRQIPHLLMPPVQEGRPRKEAVAIGPLFHDVEIRVALISDEGCG